LALQNYVTIQDSKAKWDVEKSLLRAANSDAANQLLRQQIHPHFLFNALNILKSLYRVNPKSGEEYLIRLSDFLRASISTNNIKVIPVKDEIKLCIDYLEMQKIRFDTALQYSFSISEDVLNTGFLPSFSLQPLLENAIKHNELTDESPLYIRIIQEGERIKVSNNLKIKATSEISTGSGLTNLAERYKILAGDEIHIQEDNDSFSVSIKILQHEDSNYRR
jgi:LytS/YehU family sensor histidine kinase